MFAKIEVDEHTEPIRQAMDWTGIMVCWHRRYTLGDEHDYKTPDEFLLDIISNKEWNEKLEDLENEAWYSSLDPEDREYIINKAEKDNFILPVYMYDHSGLAFNTSGFSCGWDSGQVGYIYVNKDNIKEMFGWSRLSKKRRDKVYDILQKEVELLNATPYSVIIEDIDGKVLDCIGGLYGEEAVNDFLADEYPNAERIERN